MKVALFTNKLVDYQVFMHVVYYNTTMQVLFLKEGGWRLFVIFKVDQGQRLMVVLYQMCCVPESYFCILSSITQSIYKALLHTIRKYRMTIAGIRIICTVHACVYVHVRTHKLLDV